MQNFQGTFETHKRSLVSAFPVCVTVPSNFFDFVQTARIQVINITESFIPVISFSLCEFIFGNWRKYHIFQEVTSK